MTRRTVRRLAWIGVALCLVALALGVTERLLEALPGVTEANLNRIRHGMTLADVERILGGPGCCYADAATARHWVGDEAQRFYDWTGARGRAWVGLDGAGKVTRSGFEPAGTAPVPLPRLRSLLGW